VTAYDVTEHFTRPVSWTDILVRCMQWKRDMRFGIWEDTIKLDIQEVGAGTRLIRLRIGMGGECL